MSITHRITGAILAGGCFLITAFLVAAAMGQNYYEKVTSLTHTFFGALVLFAWSLVLFYHMCNGIRHLVWDTGAMFEKRQAAISGWVVLIAAVILNTITWYFAKA